LALTLLKFSNPVRLLPGLLLAVGLAGGAFFLSDFIGSFSQSVKLPISPILLAIVLGVIVKSTFGLSPVFKSGIDFGIKKLLRFGIVLMGIRLSIFEVIKIGSVAIFMVALCIAAALAITLFLSQKIGMSQKLGALIAAGTSICGVSAIVAVSPTIDARENETTYAIAVITLFGIVATLFYPYLTELVFNLPVVEAGFFMGTSVHDTSQVVATSLIYDQLWSHKSVGGLSGADIAITTKLIRNTFMVIVIPFLGFWFEKNKTDSRKSKSKTRFEIIRYIPIFVIGYILMGFARSLGDFIWGGDNYAWVQVWSGIKLSASYLITIAIACIGLSTDVRKIFKLGYKPLLCGLTAALTVGLVSWILVTQFGKYLNF